MGLSLFNLLQQEPMISNSEIILNLFMSFGINFSLVFGFVFGSFYFVSFLRKNIPYEKTICVEANKTYEIHHFPTLGTIKYYHNGKLHRELDAAVIDNITSDKSYYLNGSEFSKEDFEKEFIKQKINIF